MSEKVEINQVMLSFKISKSLKNKGLTAGKLPLNHLTFADQEAKNKRNINQVGKKKAFRLDRVDTAGNVQSDAGNLLFFYKANGIEFYVNPSLAVVDLDRMGYRVSKVEILEKQGDKTKMGFLRIWFSTEKPKVNRWNSTAAELIKLALGRTYRHCSGFINPPDPENNDPINTTFNFSGPVVDKQEIEDNKYKFKSLRILSKLGPAGHAKCA